MPVSNAASCHVMRCHWMRPVPLPLRTPSTKANIGNRTPFALRLLQSRALRQNQHAVTIAKSAVKNPSISFSGCFPCSFLCYAANTHIRLHFDTRRILLHKQHITFSSSSRLCCWGWRVVNGLPLSCLLSRSGRWRGITV